MIPLLGDIDVLVRAAASGTVTLWLLSLSWILALSLGLRLLPRAPWDLRLLAVFTCWCWVLTVGFHLAMRLGQFRLVPIAAVCAGISLLLGLRGRSHLRKLKHALLNDVRSAERSLSGALARGAWRLAIGALLLLVAARALLVVPGAWDTLTYHGPKAALWISSGSPISLEAPSGWSFYRHYFSGGEILPAWAMLPFHSDVLLPVVDWIPWLALGLGLWSLGRLYRIRGHLRVLGVLYVLTVPSVALAVGSSYVDSLFHALVIAALVFAIRYRRSKQGPYLILLGMSLGLAAGIKVTAISYAGLMVVVLLLLELRDRDGGRLPWGPLLLAGASGLAVWLPWVSDNVSTLGAPLGSVPLTVLGIDLGRAVPEMTWYLDRPWIKPYDLVLELRAILSMFNWINHPGPHLSAFSLPVLLGGVLAVPAVLRRDRGVGLLALAVAAASLYNLYQPSFSVVRLQWAAASARFLVPALAVLLFFLLRETRARPRLAVALATYLLITIALFTAQLLSVNTSVEVRLIAAVMVALALAGIAALRRLSPARWPRAAMAAIATVAILGTPMLVTWKQGHRYTLLAANEVLHPVPLYWIDAAAALDRPNAPRSVAFTTGPDQNQDQVFLYHFFGSELQNRLFYVTSAIDGAMIHHDGPDLHMAQRAYDEWIERLRQLQVTHVVSFCPRSLELGWMEEHPERFRRAVGDATGWGLYEIGTWDAVASAPATASACLRTGWGR